MTLEIIHRKWSTLAYKYPPPPPLKFFLFSIYIFLSNLALYLWESITNHLTFHFYNVWSGHRLFFIEAQLSFQHLYSFANTFSWASSTISTFSSRPMASTSFALRKSFLELRSCSCTGLNFSFYLYRHRSQSLSPRAISPAPNSNFSFAFDEEDYEKVFAVPPPESW